MLMRFFYTADKLNGTILRGDSKSLFTCVPYLTMFCCWIHVWSLFQTSHQGDLDGSRHHTRVIWMVPDITPGWSGWFQASHQGDLDGSRHHTRVIWMVPDDITPGWSGWFQTTSHQGDLDGSRHHTRVIWMVPDITPGWSGWFQTTLHQGDLDGLWSAESISHHWSEPLLIQLSSRTTYPKKIIY